MAKEQLNRKKKNGMEINILDNGRMILGMVKVLYIIQMEMSTLGILQIINIMAMEHLNGKVEKNILDNGRMILFMVKVLIIIQMEMSTLGIL